MADFSGVPLQPCASCCMCFVGVDGRKLYVCRIENYSPPCTAMDDDDDDDDFIFVFA